MAAFSEYLDHDALGLAELVAKGAVHPRELVEAAIENIEAQNATLNAVVHKRYERAVRAADGVIPDGPFRGVPFLLKDLGAPFAGEPLTFGSRFMHYYVADFDSELVRRYKQAGLIMMGRTNTPEFGLVAVTEPELYGPTRNPWDTTRSPGGSSGGSAAAVAAGFVPIAHGNDGGGSIRIPAAACGLFGLKPSRGRVPQGPEVGEAGLGLVQDHVLTRSVRDSAALLDATHGPDLGAPFVAPPPSGPYSAEVTTDPGPLRIAVSSQALFGTKTHPDHVMATQAAADLLESLGHHVEEAVPPFDREALTKTFLRLWAAALAGDLKVLAASTGRPITADKFELTTWVLALVGEKTSAGTIAADLAFAHRESRRIAGFFERYDVFAGPTLARPPVRIGELAPTPQERTALEALRRVPSRRLLEAALDRIAAQNLEATPNTMLFNLTGQPAMSVPLFWGESGLPIGIQFAGRFGDESTLFRLAGQLEQARPWAATRPGARH